MALFNSNKNQEISEINVTPFVDVMLVLLVIFMMTAPLLLNGIKLNLPKTKEVNQIRLTNKQVVLSVTKDGSLYLGEKEVSLEEIDKKIKDEFKKHRDNTLYFRADFALNYGRVAKLISHLKKVGINKIALITVSQK